MLRAFGPVVAAAVLAWPHGAVAQTRAADPRLERPITPGTPSEIPLRVKEIGEDLFMITGRGGNSVVRRTSAGLILIDDKVMYAQVYRELRETLDKKIADQPVRYAFVTHHHADHSGNNQQLIDAGARLIGHRSLASILKTYKSTISPINPAVPDVLFDKIHAVDLGGIKAIAYHWGPGHTASDIAVYFPDRRVVAAGDILNGSGELAIDYMDASGSLTGLLSRIDDLLRLDFVTAVPGHGDNVMTREEVRLYRQRVASFIARGVAAVRRGVTAEGLPAAMRSDDLGFRLVGHFWSDPRNLALLHEDLRGSVRGPAKVLVRR